MLHVACCFQVNNCKHGDEANFYVRLIFPFGIFTVQRNYAKIVTYKNKIGYSKM
jgi:hypothetical protein